MAPNYTLFYIPCIQSYTSQVRTKGQTKSKWFFQADVSSKKPTNEFDFNTVIPLVNLFLFVFWKKLKTPKDISKLTDLYLQFNMQYTLWNGVFWLLCKGQEIDFIFICLRFMIMHKNSSHPLDHLPNDILFCAGTSSLYFVNPVRQCNGSI